MISNREIVDFRRKFEKSLKNANSIILTSHLSPDDDAIGSSLALYSYIKENYKNKTIKVILEAPVDENRFADLPWFKEVKIVNDLSGAVKESDLLILLDAHSLIRVTGNEDKLARLKIPMIKIDHHRSASDGFTASLVDPEASSAAELVYRLAFENCRKISKEACKLLFFGIDGDTTGFILVSDKNSYVFSIVSRLINEGKINIELFRARYEKLPERIFELIKTLYQNTQIVEVDGWPKFAFSYIEEKESNNYSYLEIKNAVEPFVNSNLKKIQGVTWAFVLYPRQNQTGLSCRSTVGSVNVRNVVEYFGGGGHDLSAGAHINGKSVKEVEKELLAYLKKTKPNFA